jgi:hypothetical protein
MKARGTKINR